MNRRCGSNGQWEQLNVNEICRPLDDQQKILRWKSLLEFFDTQVSFTALTNMIPVFFLVLFAVYLLLRFFDDFNTLVNLFSQSNN